MNNWVDFAVVKGAVSLEAVLRHYRVPALRQRRSQLAGRCPIHQGQRDDSFRASLAKNVFHCFACQAHGDVLDFVAAMDKCSVREAALRLQGWFGVAGGATKDMASRRSDSAGRKKEELVRKKECCNHLLDFVLTGIDHNHPYLAQRGVDRGTVFTFGVGFYAGPGLMSGRVVVPIHNEWGQRVAYAGRSVDGQTPKYKLPFVFRKGCELFNLHRARATGSEAVILVEGYFDCMRVHQAGFPWVVALMGSSMSPEQEWTLATRFEQVMVMLDGDLAGRTATGIIRAKLGGQCRVAVVSVPEGKQPDELPPTEIASLLTR